MFKLQQLQKVDSDMLERLIRRFKELDASRNGLLMIGSEVPSAAQVREMKRRQERAALQPGGRCDICGERLEGMTLVQLWGIFGPDLVKEFLLMSGENSGEDAVLMRRGKVLTDDERLELAKIAADKRESGDKITGPSTLAANGTKPIKISDCHDFAWSRSLWRIQANKLGWLTLGLIATYLFLG